ncbi:TRPM8 channel-associated factor homolog [Acipenser ruthenus]|uniref:TRPM8 channel-associated factor homolog n=1 Tax=Acipenser ruthenus TaxID=7906 RepID=UPI0027419479|nr:TRPM8 channel-associated factor homolog [Acipenser ruthenus]XP_058859202.1 TRPM8 channel-associated factor homolog [Acipenser ruthenus]
MDCKAAYASLVEGLECFDFTGDSVPGRLVLIGGDAFPVAMTTNGDVLIAASRYGKGRMVVLSHEAYMKDPRFAKFIRNAVNWLKPSPGALVGVHSSLDSLATELSSTGTKVKLSKDYNAGMGVYCMDAYVDTQVAELVSFVKQGGGLLIGGQAWHWSYLHQTEDVFFSFNGNKITSVAGVYFTAEYGQTIVCPVRSEIPRSWLAVPNPRGVNHTTDYMRSLLNGVNDFNLECSSYPSHLLVHGPLAFSIAFDENQKIFVAGARYGKGRVIVVSHETYMSHPPIKTFILNAIRWLDAGKEGKIGLGKNLTDLCDLLKQEQFPCKFSDFKEECSVYCCQAYDDDQAENIREFVAEGGGLFIGGQAWYWAYNHAVAEYPGNKILNKLGISILGASIQNKMYKAPKAEDFEHFYHFRKALPKFMNHILGLKPLEEPESGWWKKLELDCRSFLEMKAYDSHAYTSIRQLLTDLVNRAGIPEFVTGSPIKTIESRFLLNLAGALSDTQPASARKLQVNGTNGGAEAWRSTGLSASPGQNVIIEVPSTLVSVGWQVQIGCQTDDLSNLEELRRPAVVTRRFAIDKERNPVSSLWGGLIYIIVPEGSRLGLVWITVEGAERSPYFIGGKTCPVEWVESIRYYPAPWAELEFENIILTVPSKHIRSMDDPHSLELLWNRIMKAVAELAATPGKFARPERIVADVQISAGWMHSGYPIMIQWGGIQDILDLQYIKANGTWGPIHELGHNQQKAAWNFPPYTGEATNNLWSVYVHEMVLDIPRHKAHSALAAEQRKATIQQYLRNGAKLEEWTVWTCLETYLQLQEGFGWEPFIKLFSEYQSKPGLSSNNTDKMLLWAERFSQQVQKNLFPFFKAWGWPVKESSLPEWSHNPMLKYT